MRSSIGERHARRASPLVVARATSRALGLIGLLVLSACTTQTKDNFTNPPPGPPTTCTAVAPLTGCVAGSLSYSCTSGRPDDGDTSLVCDRGLPGADQGGASFTLYCCAPYGQSDSECVPAPNLAGCGAQSLGFACQGEVSPDEVDTSLVCSGAVAGDAGTRDYCCISYDQSTGVCACSSFDVDAGLCGVHPDLTGCAGAAIGIGCAASHAPSDVNPLLDCTTPDGGSPQSYCCQTP